MTSESPQVEQPQTATNATDPKRAPQRILIGSQRPGHAAEDIKAKPVSPPAPYEAKATPAPAGPSSVTLDKASPASAAEAAITTPSGTTTAPASPPPPP